jgi:hypothetical protein
MGSTPELFTNTHVDLELDGGKTIEGFYRFDMPSATLQIPEVHQWDGQGAPLKVTTAGIMSWGTVSGSCYQTADYTQTLWDLFKAAHDDPASAKKDYTLTKKTKTGDTLEQWTLKGSYISGFNTSAQEAGGNQVSSIDITIHFDDADKVG